MTSARLSLANFPEARFCGADFDGTIALTNVPTEDGKDGPVEAAYKEAIEQVFGLKGLETYLSAGGLQNRAPIEVVQQLAPDATDENAITLVGALDGTKLAILLEQITSQWPKPTAGYQDFARSLSNLKSAGRPITTAIISSGHEPFIDRTYAAWGIRPPDIILGQEAITALAGADGISLPVKPDPIIMLYAYNAWRGRHGLSLSLEIPEEDKGRMIYVGDDPEKDGQLAANSGVSFRHLQPETSQQTWSDLTSWRRRAGELALGHTS